MIETKKQIGFIALLFLMIAIYTCVNVFILSAHGWYWFATIYGLSYFILQEIVMSLLTDRLEIINFKKRGY